MRFILSILLSFFVIQALALDARFQVAAFKAPGKGAYAETYLMVSSRSVTLTKNKNKRFQGGLQVLITFEQGKKIVAFDKYVLRSPELDSISAPDFRFIDLQRFPLEIGKYQVKLQLLDVNDSLNKASTVQELEILEKPEHPQFSDLVFLLSFEQAKEQGLMVKSGYSLLPLCSNFFGQQKDTLRYYSELYLPGSLKDSVFILKTYIERQSTGEMLEETFLQRRVMGKPVEVLLAEIPINDLTTGDYNLVFELRNSNNELVEARKGFFQRLNRNKRFDESVMYSLNFSKTFVDTMSEKLLRDHVGCLRPIAEQNERTYVDELMRDKKKPDYDRMRRFIYTFWYTRNQNSPAEEWKKYQDLVLTCNKKFGNKVMRGYETERGRVFLQYGPPNSRTVVDNEPSAYPYEIWWYYTIKKQNNVRFVFYNPDLVSNDYRLIHSEAFAEPFDPQWKLLIYSRTNPINNVDQTNQREHFGNYIDQNYRNQ